MKLKKRRKDWIRYEREHSLSAGHLDWHDAGNGKQVCVVLDDANRKVLVGGEFDSATEDNSVKLVDEVIKKYGYIQVIRETYKAYFVQVQNPQTNGKVEKWFDLYRIHRKRFPNFEVFIEWYNNRPHGSLNLRRAETPEMAFWRKMPIEYYYGLAAKFFGWK